MKRHTATIKDLHDQLAAVLKDAEENKITAAEAANRNVMIREQMDLLINDIRNAPSQKKKQ